MIKIVIIYIVYDLDSWPRHLTNNFKFKNGLFGGSSTVKNCDKENYMYSEYGITLIVQVGGVLIMTLLNVVIFGVDNSSLSHSGNHKNNFLILNEVPTFGIIGSLGSPEKNFSFNFTKAKSFVSVCIIMLKIFIFFVNGKEIFKFKADSKNVNFPTRFFLGGISDGLSATESREVSLGGNVYDFSVDYNSIDKSDM